MHLRRPFLTALGFAGVIASACLSLSGCSPGADYPSLFPAVHDMPPPRAEAPMNPDQVQQATDQLVVDRDHLNSQTQGSGTAKAPSPANAAGQPAKAQPASAAAQSAAATAAGTQTAGTETK